MKNIVNYVGVGAVLGSMMSLPALAVDTVSLTGEIGATSNYVWRGISQTNEDPTVQAGLELGVEGAYVGVWGSGVDKSIADVELDVYGGYRFNPYANTTVDVGAIYYTYLGEANDADLDFYELTAGVAHKLELTTTVAPVVGLNISYAPSNQTALHDFDHVYYEASSSIDLPIAIPGIYVTSKVGYTDVLDNDNANYTNWGVGVGMSNSAFSVELGYTNTDLDDTDIAEDQMYLAGRVLF